MKRRSFCRLLGSLGIAGVAGCVSDGAPAGSDDAGTDGRPSDQPDGSRSPTGDPSPTPASDAAASASAAIGDWPSFGVDRHNTGVHPEAVGPSEGRIDWSAIEDAPTVLCSPVVADGTVYTGSAAKAVHALDPDTGERQWRYDTTSYVETAPAVADGTVYAADADGVVYALSTGGDERWTHDTEHNLHSRALAVHGGRVFVGTAGTMPAVASGDTDESRASQFLALDADSGEKLWSYGAPDWFSGPAVGGGRVYVGDHTGRVSALDPASGEKVWTWRPGVTTDDGERRGAVLAPPAYHQETLYVGLHELGWLVALDAESGDLEWRTALKAPNVKSSPAVDGETVYVGATGTESSDYDGPNEPTPTPTPTETPDECDPTVRTDGATATPTGTPDDCVDPVEMPTYTPSGSVFALSAADGTIDWRFETEHDFRSSPAVVGDRVYVGGGNYLYSLSRSSGEKQWRVAFGEFVYSSPAVVDGRAYVGSADGHLHCVR